MQTDEAVDEKRAAAVAEPKNYSRPVMLVTLLAGLYTAGLLTLIHGGHDHSLHGEGEHDHMHME